MPAYLLSVFTSAPYLFPSCAASALCTFANPNLNFFYFVSPSFHHGENWECEAHCNYLTGSNYNLWVQGMKSFLIGRKLWRYVTGEWDIVKPIREDKETATIFADRLEDSDNKTTRALRGCAILQFHLFIFNFLSMIMQKKFGIIWKIAIKPLVLLTIISCGLHFSISSKNLVNQ